MQLKDRITGYFMRHHLEDFAHIKIRLKYVKGIKGHAICIEGFNGNMLWVFDGMIPLTDADFISHYLPRNSDSSHQI